MGPVDVAVVGCGEHMLATLGSAVRATRGLRVIAACDLDRERARLAANLVGADRVYTSVEELLASERPKALIVAGPPELHFEIAQLALPAGTHLFLEKPAGVNADQVRELAALADRHGNVTLVGHNLRHSAAWSVVTSLASDPRFGRPAALQLSYLASRPRGPRWNVESPLRSFLLTHAIHPVDLAVDMFGEPVDVCARAQTIDDEGLIVTAGLTFAEGQSATIVAGTAAPNLKLHATLIGEQSQIIEMHGLHRVTSTLDAAPQRGAFRASTAWEVRTLESGLATAGYHAELAAFRDAVRGGAAAHPSLADAVSTYGALEAIAQAVAAVESIGLPT
jgi:predicted dehydrogenase